jgi:hypothetical protein
MPTLRKETTILPGNRLEISDPSFPEGAKVEVIVVLQDSPFAEKETHESFLFRAQRLDQRGRTEAALDLIYDSIDESMRKNELKALDAVLANAPRADLSTDLLLGLLTATLPAKNRLPSRPTLFRDTEAVLRNRGEYEEGLLTGLE